MIMFKLNRSRNKHYLLKEDQQSHNAHGHAPGTLEEMSRSHLGNLPESSKQLSWRGLCKNERYADA